MVIATSLPAFYPSGLKSGPYYYGTTYIHLYQWNDKRNNFAEYQSWNISFSTSYVQFIVFTRSRVGLINESQQTKGV